MLTKQSQTREWIVERGNTTHTLVVNCDGILYSYDSFTPFLSGGIQCTHSEFIAGKCQDVVREILGDQVLGEVLEIVRRTLRVC